MVSLLLKLGFPMLLDIEEVLSVVGGISCMSRLLMSSCPLTRWTGPFLTAPWGGLVFLAGSGRAIYFAYHRQVRLRFKFAAGLGECGEGWGNPLRAVL